MLDDLAGIIDLLGTGYFLTGVRIGLLVLGVGWAAHFALRRPQAPLPLAGLAIAAGVVLTLLRVEGSEAMAGEVWPLVAILVGTVGGRLLGGPLWLYPLLAAPGAAWFAWITPVASAAWVRGLILVAIPVAGFLINDFERRHAGLGLGVIAYSLAVLGMFFAVPDTEWAVALVAVVVPITFLAWPRVLVSLGIEGSYLSVAVLLWVAAQGGAPRPPSIVGSAACLGVLLLEPIVIALRPSAVVITSWPTRNAAGATLASLPQFVVVVLCSRVAARFSVFPPALLVIGLVYAGTLFLGIKLPDWVAEEEEIFEEPVWPDEP